MPDQLQVIVASSWVNSSPRAHETGASRFGLLVEDVDATHRRALDAGATEEVNAPVDAPWKPRWSCVTDPSGNNIDLYQA